MSVFGIDYESVGSKINPDTWVNSAPANNFAAQTVTVNTTDISYVYILQKFTTSNVAQAVDYIDVKGGETSKDVRTLSGGMTAARTYTVASNGVTISAPLYGDAASYAIPLMILTV